MTDIIEVGELIEIIEVADVIELLDLDGGVQGLSGTAATIEIGTVTTGTPSSVTNVGTTTAAILDFVLEKGDTGDNTEWIKSTVDPTTEGIDGDLYLNYTTWHVWEKISGAWEDKGTIKGIDGEPGAPGVDGTDGDDGNTILSGTADPTTEGIDGDWYINRTTWHIWEKATGAWTDRGSIKGEDGGSVPAISTGDAGKFLKVNATETDTEWTALSLDSAPKLTTARTISLGGDVSGSASFDGSQDITITATVADASNTFATLDADRIYDGVNLETKFAAEIAGYTDVWAWLKARITAVDYSGLHVGDYVPFVMNGNAIKAQIAGIDTYREYGDVAIGHHIDFISKDCYPVNVLWNTTNVNNGSAANAAPWMISNIKSVLNTTWYGYLPVALQAQIIEKRLHIETRYSSGSTIKDSTSWAWNDIGKLWVPSEFEVYGGIVWGTKGFSQNGSVQYPIFSGNSEKRIKNQGDGGDRCAWWLLSVSGGTSTTCCHVHIPGYAALAPASTATLYAPVCFRIG